MLDWANKKEWDGYALVATVARASKTQEAGVPSLGAVWWIVAIVIVIQIIIAALPGSIYAFWSWLTITVSGTLLTLLHGSLPQWREEEWDGRRLGEKQMKTTQWSKPRREDKTIILTPGNGSTHALVIVSEGYGLD